MTDDARSQYSFSNGSGPIGGWWSLACRSEGCSCASAACESSAVDGASLVVDVPVPQFQEVIVESFVQFLEQAQVIIQEHPKVQVLTRKCKRGKIGQTFLFAFFHFKYQEEDQTCSISDRFAKFRHFEKKSFANPERAIPPELRVGLSDSQSSMIMAPVQPLDFTRLASAHAAHGSSPRHTQQVAG